MKLHGIIDIKVAGTRVHRDPNFWDKLKRGFGGKPDLATNRMKASLEAVTLVEAVRRAMERLGARNAIALVIDNQVLFEDRHGRTEDLADLMLAFHDAAPVFGAGFSLLRLAVEHEEAGLHLVMEVVARGEHPDNETAARIAVSGRIRELEPRPGEAAEAYRARVEPLTRQPTMFEAHRMQFESFVTRLADAMRGALAEAEILVRTAQAQIEQPPSRGRRDGRPVRAPTPTDPRYDPYLAYYPSPMDTMLSMMMWGSIMSWGMTPSYIVVDHHGDTMGTTDELASDGMADAADSTLDGGDGSGGGGGDGSDGESGADDDGFSDGDDGNNFGSGNDFGDNFGDNW